LEMAPVKDSILAVTDESYFDWPVLPEAPSSLNVSLCRQYCEVDLASAWWRHNWDRGGAPTRRCPSDKRSLGSNNAITRNRE